MVSALWGPAYPTGSGIYASELADRLVKKGHEVHVFCSNIGEMENNGYDSRIVVSPLKTWGFAWNMNPISNPFFKILNGNYDIVHVHSYIFFISNLSALARGFGDFKYVLQFHGGLNHRMPVAYNNRRMWVKDKVFDRTLGYVTVRRADELLSVAKADIPLIKEKFDREAMHVPNAVSLQKFSSGVNEPNYITYVGKFEEWKGFSDMFKIFEQVRKEVKGSKLLLVGTGSLNRDIVKNDPDIIVRGHVSHEDMPSIYRNSAATVLPSYMEGSPTVCLESLASGVPCVATDVGDTSDIVVDGENGYLCNPGDINAMAKGLVQLLTDDGMRCRFGQSGRKRVIEKFNYDVISDKIIDIYKNAMAK